MEELKKELKKHTEKLKELKKFEKENRDVLLKHFELNEMKNFSEFTLKERAELMVEEGKINAFVFLENEELELRVYPDKKEVKLFDKSLYNVVQSKK